MRPLDRDAVLHQGPESAQNRTSPSEQRAPAADHRRPAIEDRADLDLDALVTECAPLDALIQRFGRVDRDGPAHRGRSAAGHVGRARHLCTAPADDNPIYGACRCAETWDWLAAGTPSTSGPADRPERRSQDGLCLPDGPGSPQPAPQPPRPLGTTSHLPDADSPAGVSGCRGLRDAAPRGTPWSGAPTLPGEVLPPADATTLIQLRTLIEACPPGRRVVLARTARRCPPFARCSSARGQHRRRSARCRGPRRRERADKRVATRRSCSTATTASVLPCTLVRNAPRHRPCRTRPTMAA